MNLEDLKEGDYLIYTERPYSDYADGLELIEASPEGLRARSVARRDVGGGSFKLYTDPKPWLLAAYFDPKCWFPATDFVPGNCPIAYLLRWFKNHEITEAGVAVQRRALVPHSVIAYRWGTTNDHSYPAPSMAGEDKPETNPIRDIEHLLGSRVLRMHDGDSYEQIEEYAAKLAEFYKIKRIAQP
jgi:hypothetical protein